MRKIIALLIIILLSLIFLNVGYGLWSHDTDVAFNLTISPPKDDGKGFNCCICGTYDTIEEGLTILETVQYDRIHNWMDEFEAQLKERTLELENMPIGSVTADEIRGEVARYREDIIGKEMGGCITTYGNHCLARIRELYQNPSSENKEEVVDFWKRYDGIWVSSDELWARRDKLYPEVDSLEQMGQSRVKPKKE